MNFLTRLWKEEDGQALTEYGLLVGLIAIAVITALGLLATELDTLFKKVKDELVKANAK